MRSLGQLVQWQVAKTLGVGQQPHVRGLVISQDKQTVIMLLMELW